jgi:hypothetical protein
VSDERPLPNVLSEQEVLLKAADVLIEMGVFESSYYAYQQYPALRNAKIEAPILVIDAQTGEPRYYIITAVDNDIVLAEVQVKTYINSSDERFIMGRGFALPGSQNHFITRREAVELIKSQFPDKTVSEPLAIGNLWLENDKQSHRFIYWYFTVSDNGRSASGEADEYVIGTVIPGYPAIPGGVSNRAAIDYAGQRGDFHLQGYRMAKLNSPLRLFDKLNEARAAGGTFSSSPDTERVGITPVPLK